MNTLTSRSARPCDEHSVTPRSCAGLLFALVACAGSLIGCASSQSAPTALQSADAARKGEPVIMLDGEFRDWPTDATAVFDEHHVFFRFSVQDERYTLQAAPRTTAILIDADADASTGWQPEPSGDLAALGVDLEVQFSPRRDNGEAGRGVALFRRGADGSRVQLETHDWDFSAAPTYASQWYEARLSRTPEGPRDVPSKGLLSSGPISGAYVTYNERGSIDASSDVWRMTLEAPCMDHGRRSPLTIPAKEPGAVRIISYNVLRSSPVAKPEVYARIFRALDPDIVLVQEWEVQSARELAEWFNANLPREGGWDAVVQPGLVREGAGVGVVSRFDAKTAIRDVTLEPPEGTQWPNPYRVRAVGADIDTAGPMGRIMALSVHLKSGGNDTSDEDRRRMAEARAINAAVRNAIAALGDDGANASVLIGGDINLVGSRPPLDVLRAGLDTDASDLDVASARTLGDRTMVTWTEAGNPFGPGRLDYIVSSDAAMRVSRAFVLDTSRLDDASLAAAGLQLNDSADASDHKPVVVDLIRR